MKAPAWQLSFPWATLGRREAGSDFLKKCSEQRGRIELLKKRPRFSLVIYPANHVDVRWTVESIEAQSYPDFEIIVAESGKKNEAALSAQGDWVGFLDAGDVLSPAALYQFAVDLQDDDFDLIYTNETLLAESPGKLEWFLAKPAFSAVDLLHFNYIGRFWLCKTSRFQELGGFARDLPEFYEHDFLLRLTEKSPRVKHEPFYYYYRRTAPPVTSFERLVPIVEKHLKRLGIAGSAEPSALGVRVRPVVKKPKDSLISAVVCFRNRSDWTIQCAQRFAAAAGTVPVELLLVNNQSSEAELEKIKAGIAGLSVPVRIIDYDRPFNFGNMHNVVVRDHARGDYLFLLNNDVFLEGDGVLDELVAWAQFTFVGTVGMLLTFPQGGVQHGGFRAIFGGESRMARVGHVGDEPFSFENREVFGNTFAACLMKRETFDTIGGLSEISYPNGFGDVAFNFSCLRKGLKNLYVGHVRGVHLESASRGIGYEYWEECGIEEEFPDILQQMLREDLGYNRVPGADFPLRSLLKQALTQRLFEKAPWLLPWKPRIKRLMKWAPG